jgi:RNA polymerase sigma factor (sigma-70 family)
MNSLPPIEEMIDQYASPLLRYAERLLRNPHTAQDVVQQVFVRFASMNDAKKPAPQALRAWLYRSTHHQAVDQIRAEQRRKKLHEAHAEQCYSEPSTNHSHRQQQVMEQIHLLDEKSRQVLLLRLQEGLSYKEISQITGLKEGHIGYLLHQAVRQLASQIRPKETRI